MKIKMIMFFCIISFFIFLIYIENQDKKIYYVNIDSTSSLNYNIEIKNRLQKDNKLEKYINLFSKKDLRTTDLIKEIESNYKIKEYNIQNVLIKADLITLNIGSNDIEYKIGHTNQRELLSYTDEIFKDIEKLFKLIRVYSKEKIYILEYKNVYGSSYDDYFSYVNKQLKKISLKYNIKVVNNDQLLYIY